MPGNVQTFGGIGAVQRYTEVLSSGSTALTLTYAQSGKLLLWNSQTSAARIFLPQPELGLEFQILFLGPPVSTATKIGPTTGTGRDVAVDGTTGAYGRNATSVGETGMLVRCVGVSDTRYALIATRTSTIQFAAATSG